MSSVIGYQSFYKHISREPELVNNEIGHFNIFKIEDMLLPKHKQVSYSRRNFYKISLVTGHSKIHYADQCIEVNGTVLVFTNPMVPYLWERVTEKQSGYICIFTEAFFSRFGNIKDYPVFQSVDNAVIPLAELEVNNFTDLFSRMFDELQSDYVYKYDLLRNLLMSLIHDAQKMKPATGNSATGSNAAERITSIFAELLERQFPIEYSNQVMQLSSPSAFAKQLNVHVNHLNKALKEITGQTTTQLINERILQEAKVLLKSTNWSIAEIAWSLGFEEPNHFSSFFKSRTKTTPVKFRQDKID
ncbi:helix-turn-helix domain-containing protein [Mucilaginibacter jinjuensis]|uniref:Helix-turn-helix transcriptional regulator n=1 Tax=Mucilaginibacter jinjuensis TaxID=1176721 RepID=A0ABY7T0R6_9SPHI|nr:AraC family transcriptional regulator [Mucilaginibacter jinjuensis]WCT09858.1 helix-turn-helix transcriptional regulator [Mucilaginibacter jinjuensis]